MKVGAADEDRARQSAASAALVFADQHRWWIVGSAVSMIAAASVAWMAGRASQPAAEPESPPTVEATIPAVPDHPAADPAKEQRPIRAAESSSSPPTPAAVAAAAEPSVDETQTAGDTLADAPAKTDSSPGSKSPAKAPQESPATSGTLASDSPAPAEAATKPSARPQAATASDGLPPAVVAATPTPDEDAEPAIPFDPAKQAELMSHLQDKLPALDFPGVPLGQFVSFLSLASTVPMTIDHDSLAAVGKSENANHREA